MPKSKARRKTQRRKTQREKTRSDPDMRWFSLHGWEEISNKNIPHARLHEVDRKCNYSKTVPEGVYYIDSTFRDRKFVGYMVRFAPSRGITPIARQLTDIDRPFGRWLQLTTEPIELGEAQKLCRSHYIDLLLAIDAKADEE